MTDYGFHHYSDPNSLMSQKIRHVASMIYGETLLDVGCGDGSFIELVKHDFEHVTGIEPDGDLYRCCYRKFRNESNVSIELKDVFHLPDTEYDCITALDVIEHLDKPYIALLEIRRHLKTGGMFVMTTPNWFDIIRQKLGQCPQHKSAHSGYGWASLARSAGFKHVTIDAIRKPLGHHLFGFCIILKAEK